MAVTINTKLVGVTFDDRQEHVKLLQEGYQLFWKHEQENPVDPNALAVFADPSLKKQVGYIKKELSGKIVPMLKEGKKMSLRVTEMTGGEGPQSHGVNIQVTLHD